MGNFSVTFNIQNNLGTSLYLNNYSLSSSSSWTSNNPNQIGSHGAILIGDPDLWEGAAATISYTANVNGVTRVYQWYGSCPVMGSNKASGPGITNWTGTSGHPVSINIAISASTPGWTTQNGDTSALLSPKQFRAMASGKKAVDPSKVVKFTK